MASKTDTKPRRAGLAESEAACARVRQCQLRRAALSPGRARAEGRDRQRRLSRRLAASDRRRIVRAVFGQPLHRARSVAAAARGQSCLLAPGRGHHRRAAAPRRLLRARGDVDQRSRRLCDRRALCDRYHRDDRDRRQACGADRHRAAASNGSRSAASATPRAASCRCAGPRSISTANSPRSAGCCSVTAGRSSI